MLIPRENAMPAAIGWLLLRENAISATEDG